MAGKYNKFFLLTVFLMFVSLTVFSYAGDHENFPRLPGYQPWDTQIAFGATDFQVKADSYRSVEGYKTICSYHVSDPKKRCSAEQILSQVTQQVKRLGGTLIYEVDSDVGKRAILRYHRNERQTWVEVLASPDGQDYQLTIVEDSEVNRR